MPKSPAALETCRERYPAIAFDWEQAHRKVTQRFLSEFLKLAERYPETAARLKNVSVVKFTSGDTDANGYAFPDGSQIIVNTSYARDAGNAGDARRLCRHEFGHQVLHYLQAQAAIREDVRAWQRENGGEHGVIDRYFERGKTPAQVRKWLREVA